MQLSPFSCETVHSDFSTHLYAEGSVHKLTYSLFSILNHKQACYCQWQTLVEFKMFLQVQWNVTGNYDALCYGLSYWSQLSKPGPSFDCNLHRFTPTVKARAFIRLQFISIHTNCQNQVFIRLQFISIHQY